MPDDELEPKTEVIEEMRNIAPDVSVRMAREALERAFTGDYRYCLLVLEKTPEGVQIAMHSDVPRSQLAGLFDGLIRSIRAGGN